MHRATTRDGHGTGTAAEASTASGLYMLDNTGCYGSTTENHWTTAASSGPFVSVIALPSAQGRLQVRLHLTLHETQISASQTRCDVDLTNDLADSCPTPTSPSHMVSWLMQELNHGCTQYHLGACLLELGCCRQPRGRRRSAESAALDGSWPRLARRRPGHEARLSDHAASRRAWSARASICRSSPEPVKTSRDLLPAQHSSRHQGCGPRGAPCADRGGGCRRRRKPRLLAIRSTVCSCSSVARCGEGVGMIMDGRLEMRPKMTTER